MYDALQYETPFIVSALRTSTPKFGYSSNFADLVALDDENQKDYAYGVLLLVVVISLFCLQWAVVLLLLKYYGDRVGCASGQAFKTMDRSETCKIGQEIEISGSMISSEDYDQGGCLSERTTEESVSVNEHNFIQSTIKTQTSRESSLSTPSAKVEKTNSKQQIFKARRRQRRTRVIFFLCGTMICSCSIFIMVLGVTPISDARRELRSSILDVQTVIDEAETITTKILAASSLVEKVKEVVPLDVGAFCPLNRSDLVLDLDAGVMSNFFNEQYDEFISFMNSMIKVSRSIAKVQDTVDNFKNVLDRTDPLVWALPSLLLVLCLLTTATVLGVLFACKEKSNEQIEKVLSYIILPLFITTTLVCWVLTIGTAIGASLNNDACTGGIAPGSPDGTIINILRARQVEQESVMYNLVESYSFGGCKVQDPTTIIADLEAKLRPNIESIWNYIVSIDAAGNENVIKGCGKNLEEVVEVGRNIARGMNYVLKCVEQAPEIMRCERINVIYIRVAHQAFCTNMASGLSWMLVLFFIISVLTMTVISIRSAWLHARENKKKPEEQKLDEDAHIVLDEHEEYLSYVAKYRHEWEEYHGFDSSAIVMDSDLFVDEDSVIETGASSSLGSLGNLWSLEEETVAYSENSIEFQSSSTNQAEGEIDQAFVSDVESSSVDMSFGTGNVFNEIGATPPSEIIDETGEFVFDILELSGSSHSSIDTFASDPIQSLPNQDSSPQQRGDKHISDGSRRDITLSEESRILEPEHQIIEFDDKEIGAAIPSAHSD